MNKFDKVRLQKKSDKEQADLFADSMDMIARERAILKLYDGNENLRTALIEFAFAYGIVDLSKYEFTVETVSISHAQ